MQRRLEKIGISATKVSELLNLISDGSLQRLVFLVRPREGWVQFDITSLKEFMAAEAIMNGSDEDVRERLKVIAPASYWRNIFQFAVGKCFVDRDYLLDNLVSLCAGLNEDKACAEIVADETAGRAAKAVLLGSRLALDIVADGTARQDLSYELRFARIALQLVRLADEESCARLASVFHDDLKDLYVEVIEDRLGQTSFWSQLGAWYLLMSLADRDVSWAIQMLETDWPRDGDAQRALLFARGRRSLSKWALTKLAELAPKIEPLSFLHYAHPRLWDIRDLPLLSPWDRLLRFMEPGGRNCMVLNQSVWGELIDRFFFNPSHHGHELWESLKGIDFQNTQWFPLIAGARFGASPSARTLATELKRLAEIWEPNANVWFSPLPWPLAACLNRAKSKEDLLHLAQAAEQGLLGDSKHWNAAEQRWRDVGIVDDDFNAMSDDRLPLRPEISVAGFPFSVCVWSASDRYSATQLPSLLKRLRQMGNTETRAWLAFVILNLWESHRGRKGILSPDQFKELYSFVSHRPRIRRRTYWHDGLFASVPNGPLSMEWIEFFDWLGREGGRVSVDVPRREMAEELIHHFCSNPEDRQGLLPIIAEFAVTGFRCQIHQRVLDLAKRWSPQAKDDAVGLSLTSGNLSGDQITVLAKEISQSDSLARAVWRALRMASGSSLKQGARFALALLGMFDEASEREATAADHARRTLNEFLTNRPSLLQDPDVWKRLNLPERV